MSISKNILEKIRDLVGLTKVGFIMGQGKPIKPVTMYHRYNIGDKVRFFNENLGAWDEAEIRSERNRGTVSYTHLTLPTNREV